MPYTFLKENDITDINELTHYRHIQNLVANHNRLRTLKPALDHLPSIIKIDVSYNDLTELLDFTPTVNLQHADFSFNRIEVLREEYVMGFKYLKTLKLQGNNIVDVTPLRFFVNLTELDLSHNEISELGPESIADLPLTKLYMVYHISDPTKHYRVTISYLPSVAYPLCTWKILRCRTTI
jgi:internalin A